MPSLRLLLIALLACYRLALEIPNPVEYKDLATLLSDFGGGASFTYVVMFVDEGLLPTDVLKEIRFPFATFDLKPRSHNTTTTNFAPERLSAAGDFKVLLLNVPYATYSTFLYFYSALQMNVNLLCGLWYPARVTSYRNETFRFPVKASCCQSLFIQNVADVGGPRHHLDPTLMVVNLNDFLDQDVGVSVSLNREFETVCVQCGLIRPNFNKSTFEYFSGYEGRNMFVSFVTNMVHFEAAFISSLNRWIPIKGTEALMVNYFEKFMNVTLEFNQVEEYGKIEDYGSFTFWNGMIGMVYNRSADVAYGEMSVNYNRSKAVQFTSPYTIEVVSFITRKPSLIPGFAALWWPFDSLTWIIVVSSLAACVITLRLFQSSRTAHILKASTLSSSEWPNWIMVIGMILKQPGDHFYHPAQINYRLFLIIMWMYSIVITNIYCSSFTSMMSFPVYEQGIDNIADLGRAAIQNRIRCSALIDSVMLQCITEPNGQAGLAALANKVAKDPTLIARSRDEVMLRKDSSDFCVVDMRNYARKAMETLHITDAQAGRDFFQTMPSSYALQKKCYIVEKYSAAVRSMVDSGLVDYYLRQALDGNRTQSKHETIATPLEVEDVRGTVMLLAIGLAFAATIELFKAATHLFVIRSRLRKHNYAAGTRGDYTVKLMNKHDYHLFQTKIMDGSDSPHRSIGRIVYDTGGKKNPDLTNIVPKNLYVIVLPK